MLTPLRLHEALRRNPTRERARLSSGSRPYVDDLTYVEPPQHAPPEVKAAFHAKYPHSLASRTDPDKPFLVVGTKKGDRRLYMLTEEFFEENPGIVDNAPAYMEKKLRLFLHSTYKFNFEQWKASPRFQVALAAAV